jgi:two-component system response regulator QseB
MSSRRTGDAKPPLLLVEDDAQLGPLIEQVLAEQYTVTRVTDGREALVSALGSNADSGFAVMVIDRRLPGLDGLSLVAALRQRRVTAPILLLTALGTTDDKVAGLDAGANDYLVKPFEFEELLARLRALLRTYTGADPSYVIGQWTFFPESMIIQSPYLGRILLSGREASLMRLLADSPNRTFTRSQILTAVFRSDEQPNTVDTYVHYIRRKTDRDIITTVRGQGYRLGQL